MLHELFGNTGQYYERVYHPHLSRGAVGITKVEILCLHECVSETIREEDKQACWHDCVSETIREEDKQACWLFEAQACK